MAGDLASEKSNLFHPRVNTIKTVTQVIASIIISAVLSLAAGSIKNGFSCKEVL
jgi:hypothetical protein